MEDYKKKYEQILAKAKAKIETFNHLGNASVVKSICEIFPELKESEDERIRESIIDLVEKQMPKSENKKWMIAWLEKQGKKIDAIENFNTEFERQISHLIASTINKEHEYNEGFVKWTANALLNYAKHELEKKGEQKSTWSEEDEKMLKSVISSIRISRSSCEEDDDVRDLFDNEIDWLESLEERFKETKSATEITKRLIMTRKEEIINYAKSYQGKGIESEELKDIIKLAIIDGALWADAHPKWKPSDEQMEALWNAIPHIPNSEKDVDTITELSVLYNDLKKLREE